jgi:hypothetical protein
MPGALQQGSPRMVLKAFWRSVGLPCLAQAYSARFWGQDDFKVLLQHSCAFSAVAQVDL